MNLIEKWSIGNILIIVDIVITFEYMNNEEDRKDTPGRSGRRYRVVK